MIHRFVSTEISHIKSIKAHLCFPSESMNSRVLVLGTNGEVCARTAAIILPDGDRPSPRKEKRESAPVRKLHRH